MRVRKGASGAVVLILVLIIVGLIAVSIDLIDCPNCGNIPFVRNLDSYCKFDGKVTTLQYLLYVLG